MLHKLHLVAGARPNFMKIAPLYHALTKEQWCEPIVVHTGQHYDKAMSQTFFDELLLPEPEIHLGVGSGTHAQQTARVMEAYEAVCLNDNPSMTIVVGDVNSTLACSLAATKLNIPVAHLEAGLRSFDRTMPEEINRILTDAISDLLLTPSPDADENLLREGVVESKIKRVGNIMIDSFEMLRPGIEAARAFERYSLTQSEYGVVTIHRPSNVDSRKTLTDVLDALNTVSGDIPLIFPVHPRTSACMEAMGLKDSINDNITLIPPVGYVDFMSLVSSAKVVITDSGGVQEETSYLDIPCITLRPNTERPITTQKGSNRLAAIKDLSELVQKILKGDWPHVTPIDLWDGNTASRCCKALRAALDKMEL